MAGTAEEEPVEHRPALDEERAERRRAALGHIRQWGDPVLRSVTSDVTVFDGALRQRIERMELLMDDAIGAGLAAPQVGSLERLFIYRLEPDGPVTAVVNPRIVWRSEEEETEFEGCLSLSEVIVEVTRPVAVKVEAQDLDGKPITIDAEGFEARVIQHEYDHLEGILTVDRADPEQRREALRDLRERSGSPAVS